MTNERDRGRKGNDQTQRGGNEGSSNPNDQQLQREQQGQRGQQGQGGNRQQGSESERGRSQGGQGQQQQGGGNRQQQGGANVGQESERSRDDELGQEGRERGRKDR